MQATPWLKTLQFTAIHRHSQQGGPLTCPILTKCTWTLGLQRESNVVGCDVPQIDSNTHDPAYSTGELSVAGVQQKSPEQAQDSPRHLSDARAQKPSMTGRTTAKMHVPKGINPRAFQRQQMSATILALSHFSFQLCTSSFKAKAKSSSTTPFFFFGREAIMLLIVLLQSACKTLNVSSDVLLPSAIFFL